MALSQIPSRMLGNSQLGANTNSTNVGVPIIENSPTISTSYSISTGSNALSAGPITIADGITVVIPDGSVWTIL
jgi:hypothetical protein